MKNENGFAMVLSLVLLLAMSLMGGALILISSGDHQSNNDSDQYQQTFYMAEMALLAGEQYLTDQQSGPWDSKTNARDATKKDLEPQNNSNKFEGTMNYKNYTPGRKYDFKISKTKSIKKEFIDTKKLCFNSFKDINRDKFYVLKTSANVDYSKSENFGIILENSFNKIPNSDEMLEASRMKEFYYEYFITNIGERALKSFGTSMEKSATDASSNGIGFRVYGCGIYAGKKPMIVTLESDVVLPK